MSKLPGTKRNMYTKSRVKEMRLERKGLKPKKVGVPTALYQDMLGDLVAAGHLRLRVAFNAKMTNVLLPTGPSGQFVTKDTTLNFTTPQHIEYGNGPDFVGYLESAFDADKKTYKVKAWLNEDCTLRLELVRS